MILMGFNPDQQEDPPAPSNSRPGPYLIRNRIQTIDRWDPQRRTRLFIPFYSWNRDPHRPGPDVSQLPSGLKRLRCRIGSVHHCPPGIYPYFRVFTGETLRPFSRSAAASRWSSSRRAATTTPEPDGVFTGKQSAEPGCEAAGLRGVGGRCSEGWFPGWAFPDVRWICRDRDAAVISQPRP